jgi:arylsulfatase A-like enzyme
MGDSWDAGELPSVRPVIERIGGRWLTTAAKRAGYETFGAVGNLWVSQRTEFHRGFDSFVTRRGETLEGAEGLAPGTRSRRPLPEPLRRARRRVAAQARLQRGNRDNGARRLVSAFEGWHEARDPREPFFAFFNFMEPHAPYVPPKGYLRVRRGELPRAGALATLLEDQPRLMLPYNLGLRDLTARDRSILRRLYEGEVAYADDMVGRLVDRLESRGELDRTVIVVTSDHGENVGDHHLLSHNMSLHETLLRVPLALCGPGVPPGRRPERVSMLGLHAALLEVFTGASQAGSLLSDGQGNPVLSEYESALHQVRALGPFLAARERDEGRFPSLALSKGAVAYRGRFKALAVGDRVEVFDLERDPDEGAPLATVSTEARTAADEASTALETLQRSGSRAAETTPVDEEIVAHLEALGYL